MDNAPSNLILNIIELLYMVYIDVIPGLESNSGKICCFWRTRWRWLCRQSERIMGGIILPPIQPSLQKHDRDSSTPKSMLYLLGSPAHTRRTLPTAATRGDPELQICVRSWRLEEVKFEIESTGATVAAVMKRPVRWQPQPQYQRITNYNW